MLPIRAANHCIPPTCHGALPPQVRRHVGRHSAAPGHRNGRRWYPQLVDVVAPAALSPHAPPHQRLKRQEGEGGRQVGSHASSLMDHSPAAASTTQPPFQSAAQPGQCCCCRHANTAVCRLLRPSSHLGYGVEGSDDVVPRLQARRAARQPRPAPAALPRHARAATVAPPPPALFIRSAQRHIIWRHESVKHEVLRADDMRAGCSSWRSSRRVQAPAPAARQSALQLPHPAPPHHRLTRRCAAGIHLQTNPHHQHTCSRSAEQARTLLSHVHGQSKAHEHQRQLPATSRPRCRRLHTSNPTAARPCSSPATPSCSCSLPTAQPPPPGSRQCPAAPHCPPAPSAH